MSNPGKMSPTALAALLYITVGSLIVVWSTVGGVYFLKHPPEDPRLYYWGAGVMGTGVTLVVIGLVVGRIIRRARHAELPPEAVTPVATRPQQGAAVQPPHISAVQPTAQNNPTSSTFPDSPGRAER
jgi:hypothetical protein